LGVVDTRERGVEEVRKRFAELALGLGLVGFAIMVLPGLALLFAYIALVLGSFSFLRAGLRPSTLSARSVATAMFLTSAMVWPLAKPMDLDTPQTEANADARVIGVIQSVHDAQVNYVVENGYFDSLECLLQASCIPGTPYPPRYLSADVLRSTQTTGYRYQLIAGPRAHARASEPVSPTATTSYAMVATPVGPHDTLLRSFCGDATGHIYYRLDGKSPLVEGGRCVDRERQIR
jgi:hypothetical protein